VDNLKRLQDEAVNLANRIDAVRAIESTDADKIAERDLELETLNADASKLAKKIDFERSVADSAKSLRSVVDRCTPAPEVTEERKAPRIQAVPFHGKLKAFRSHEDAYKSGMQLKATLLRDAEAKRWCEDAGIEVRAQGSTGSTTGSAFVPDILLSDTVLRLVTENSSFASNALNIQMPSDVVLVPRRTGGATVNWQSENVAITDSDPTSNQVTLTARKATAATRIANELLSDAVNPAAYADWIASELALTLTNAIENIAYNGNSANAPSVAGILTANGLLAGSAATYAASLVTAAGDTPDEVTRANLLRMMALMPSHSRAGAKWYCSPYFFADCMQALDAAQGGSVGLSQGLGLTFMGYPVVLTDEMPSSGDQTGNVFCLFANLANAAIFGTRQGIELASSSEVAFLSDQTVLRATARVAISWHTLGTDTVAGPVIGLRGA
jgi:HK97 family phage major capsid protein